MILQVVSEGLRRLITTRVKSNRMLIMRTMLNVLLDALTIGVFQNLQVTANEKRVTTIPTTVNTRRTIPPGLEYLRLATGKSTQWVLASLDLFPLGHSVQVSRPGIGLTVPRGHATQFQQQGEVMDFLVPAGHWSKHSNFGGWFAGEFQRMFWEKCSRLVRGSFSFHFPTTTSSSRLV